MKKKYVKYHNDGTIWAKGTMLNGLPDGYWNGLEKMDHDCAQDILPKANRLANGPPTINKAACTRSQPSRQR